MEKVPNDDLIKIEKENGRLTFYFKDKGIWYKIAQWDDIRGNWQLNLKNSFIYDTIKDIKNGRLRRHFSNPEEFIKKHEMRL